MIRSGLASSISLPSSRIAAMSASNCSGISVGGLTNNCGACTVATAATIFPISNLSSLVHPFYAQLFKFVSQAVHIQPQFTRAQAVPVLLYLGHPSLAGFGDLGRLLARNHHHAVHIADHHIARLDRRARA